MAASTISEESRAMVRTEENNARTIKRKRSDEMKLIWKDMDQPQLYEYNRLDM